MNFLQRRIGPVPAWALVGVAALGIWWFFLRRPAGARPAGQQGVTPSAQSLYGLGFAQGQQAGQPTQSPPPAPGGCPPDTGLNLADWQSFQGTWEYKPGGTYGTFVKNCIAYSHIANPSQVTSIQQSGGNVYYFPSPGVPAIFPGAWFPASVWSGAPAGSSAGSGVGGPGGGAAPGRKHAIGSRGAAPWWHEAHPMVGAPVRYPHFVRAVGGPRRHAHEIHRVANQAGVHPARVAMLNPVPTGMIRVA